MLYSRVGDTEITRKSRGVKKARYLPGDGDAKNRFIRCQFCGFIIDTKKISPTQSRSSINIIESDIKEEVITCEDELLYYYLITESLDPINAQDSYEILFPYKLPYQNPIMPALKGAEGQYILIESQNNFAYYNQYGPIKDYEITSNCPFCGAQYTK